MYATLVSSSLQDQKLAWNCSLPDTSTEPRKEEVSKSLKFVTRSQAWVTRCKAGGRKVSCREAVHSRHAMQEHAVMQKVSIPRDTSMWAPYAHRSP